MAYHVCIVRALYGHLKGYASSWPRPQC